jgi:hypothetical protein
MAETNEPKQEPVPIAVPPKPGAATPSDTVRLRLPARPLAGRPMPPAPTAAAGRPPPAKSSLPSSTSRLMPPDSAILATEPKKETTHTAIFSDPLPDPTLRMRKIQALSPTPETIPIAPLPIASDPEQNLLEDSVMKSIPMLFCWALLGISAATLLIQIWTYFS